VRKGDAVLAALGPLSYELFDGYPRDELLVIAKASEGAAAFFEDALALAPGLPAALLGLARAHALWGRVLPSTHLAEASIRYDAYLAERPDDLMARMEAAKLAVSRRDYAKASRHLTAVLAADASLAAGGLVRGVLDRDYVALCPRYGDLGDLDLAREALRRALSVAPKEPACLEELGEVSLLESGAARARGDEAAAERLLAEAEAALAPIVRPTSKELNPVRVLAQVLYARGKTAEAVALLERTRDAMLFGGGEDSALAAIERQLGLYEFERKNWAAAARAWRHAFDLASDAGPDRPGAENNLAWVLCQADDPAVYDPRRAVPLAREAVELTHWLTPAYVDTLAEAYFGVGDYRAALATIERAIALGPLADDSDGWEQYLARRDKYLAAMRRSAPAGRATAETWWSHRRPGPITPE
jgi:tetratricopeptide (TPR) repeat protein